MDRFINNKDFDHDVICEKLSELNERRNDETDAEKRRELIYAQMIQGMKLNTQYSRRQGFYF